MSSKGLHDFSHCTICTEIYNETNRRPKLLSCGHTLCLKCLQELFSRTLDLPVYQQTSNLRCPSCRQTTEIFHVCCVSRLPDNFAIINFLTDEESSKQYCKKHQDEKIKFFCHQCQRLLCPSCALQHVTQTLHKIENVESAALKYRQQIHLAINDCKEKQNRLDEIIQKAEVEKLKLENLSRSFQNIAIATNDLELLFQKQILQNLQTITAKLSETIKHTILPRPKGHKNKQSFLIPPGYWSTPLPTEK
ncbi:E3 ubiquitin-protein ligase TRIM32-like [Pseudophryne corroboree]|uniref:E3 ubiquitin-protein ligase TRIM32-like n=1 Tax=Pseudophryne corroboree TaxID=495146 RepID=UPI0030819318